MVWGGTLGVIYMSVGIMTGYPLVSSQGCGDKIFSNLVGGLGCHCLYQSFLAIFVWAKVQSHHRPSSSYLPVELQDFTTIDCMA